MFRSVIVHGGRLVCVCGEGGLNSMHHDKPVFESTFKNNVQKTVSWEGFLNHESVVLQDDEVKVVARTSRKKVVSKNPRRVIGFSLPFSKVLNQNCFSNDHLCKWENCKIVHNACCPG